MGHSQPPTPIHTINSAAKDVINNINATKADKDHGHALPLAKRQQDTQIILQILLIEEAQSS